ncbi:MAG: hypothetical protein CL884_04455 [Dehalococcoidia bacterium]|nr:hypothetical protein [Dehalococcoidia bacterium]
MASDKNAAALIESKGIKSAPITIVDDSEVIIGFYPRKLIATLNIKTQVDLSAKTEWLKEKYRAILSGSIRASKQFSIEQLETTLPWRPQTLLDHMKHIISFPELAYASHSTGSMSTDDMRASYENLKNITTPEQIELYGNTVISHISDFLDSNDYDSFDRVVPAHYGGEVTVLELLTIILSHSTHHLKQTYMYMEEHLNINIESPATESDFAGIITPEALI